MEDIIKITQLVIACLSGPLIGIGIILSAFESKKRLAFMIRAIGIILYVLMILSFFIL